jgi:hypothetical protein
MGRVATALGFGSQATGVPAVPEPIGHADVAALAGYNVMEYSGGRGGGYPHFNMKGDPSGTWMGLTATPQRFQGQAQMGKTTGVSVQVYPALPSDNAPPAVVAWLPDWTAGLEGGS